jgi:hypothetical protein
MSSLDAASLKEIERRRPRYWHIDGLPQLATGSGWLLWGGLYLAGLALLERRSYRLYWPIVTGCVLLWGIAVQVVMGKLKEHMTYPRAGYARQSLKERTLRRSMVGPLLLASATLTSMALRINLSIYGPLLVGGLIAIALAEPSMRPASKHHGEILYWGLLLELALSLGMMIQYRVRSATDAAVYWTLLSMGAAALLLGALRLRRFLRENPKNTESPA